jgi:predicted membrane protein (TIGR00267 family)
LFKKIKETVRKYFFEENDVSRIARRYLVMNSFDGALTILGVITGTYLAGGTDHPRVILSAGFGASLAMGISGFMGTYLTERSERTIDPNYEEEDVKSNIHKDSLFLAFVDGFSPALMTFVAVIPFVLAFSNIISVQTAFLLSMVLIMGELFGLGAFLGKIAGKNIVLHGIVTLLAGLATFLIVSILHF